MLPILQQMRDNNNIGELQKQIDAIWKEINSFGTSTKSALGSIQKFPEKWADDLRKLWSNISQWKPW